MPGLGLAGAATLATADDVTGRAGDIAGSIARGRSMKGSASPDGVDGVEVVLAVVIAMVVAPSEMVRPVGLQPMKVMADSASPSALPIACSCSAVSCRDVPSIPGLTDEDGSVVACISF